jgi:WD40-like Beta Propeller Repeat
MARSPRFRRSGASRFESYSPRLSRLRQIFEAMRPDELDRRLRDRLDALGPAPRAQLLHVLMLPDFESGRDDPDLLGQPEDPRLRRAPDRLRGGPDAPGGAGRDVAGVRRLDEGNRCDVASCRRKRTHGNQGEPEGRSAGRIADQCLAVIGSRRWRRRRKGPGAAALLAVSLAASLGIHDPVRAGAPISTPGLIAFVREGLGSGVYTMTPTGSDLTRLTDGHDYRPRWSPDGTKIAFQRFEANARSHIYVMDADGGNLERVSTRPGFQPAWAPDGTRIVFGSGRGSREEIYVMNADGSNLTHLTDNSVEDVLPAWSPDGTTIAFASDRRHNWDLYLMNPDGTDQRRLTRNPAPDQNPDWSPDSGQVVFESRRQRNWDVYSILLDGSGLRRITSAATIDWAPAWSPDATQIAFTIAGNRREDIAVFDLNSSITVRYVTPETFDLEPDWQALPATSR